MQVHLRVHTKLSDDWTAYPILIYTIYNTPIYPCRNENLKLYVENNKQHQILRLVWLCEITNLGFLKQLIMKEIPALNLPFLTLAYFFLIILCLSLYSDFPFHILKGTTMADVRLWQEWVLFSNPPYHHACMHRHHSHEYHTKIMLHYAIKPSGSKMIKKNMQFACFWQKDWFYL